jgi:hypothetical protein
MGRNSGLSRATALSESLYGPTQGLEVTLRNKIHRRLTDHFGARWYDHARVGLQYAQCDQVLRASYDLLGRPSQSLQCPLLGAAIADPSNNILITAVNGDGLAPSIISGSTNVNLNIFAYYELKAAEGMGGKPFIADDTASYPFTDAYSLFKLGNFNNGVF